MKSLRDCYKMNNGIEIPCVGFGTWKSKSGKEAEDAVEAALKAGYKHIDTAKAYENEASIGKGIKKSGVSRKEIFVTSKLPNNAHGYTKTIQAFTETLHDLDLEYLDLYLIHWPNPVSLRNFWQKTNEETWKAMEEFVEQGKIKSIGISNFRSHHIDALMQSAKIKPVINQIRLCPGCRQEETVDYCSKLGILMEAYSPLGSDGAESVLNNASVLSVAKKSGKTTAQVCVRWCLQNGYLPLPKSVKPVRIAENADIFDFEISPADMAVLNAMHENEKYIMHPDTVDF
jgi:diketogulonate reductase-like aldo/keto reductase